MIFPRGSTPSPPWSTAIRLSNSARHAHSPVPERASRRSTSSRPSMAPGSRPTWSIAIRSRSTRRRTDRRPCSACAITHPKARVHQDAPRPSGLSIWEPTTLDGSWCCDSARCGRSSAAHGLHQMNGAVDDELCYLGRRVSYRSRRPDVLGRAVGGSATDRGTFNSAGLWPAST